MSLIRKYIPYVLAATLFIQGLYFTHHILIALIGLIIVFGIIVIKNQHTKIPQDKVFYFFVLFFVYHLIGYVTFLEKGMLVYDLLRSFFYVLVYLTIHQIYDEQFMVDFKKAFLLVTMVGSIASCLAYLLDFFSINAICY